MAYGSAPPSRCLIVIPARMASTRLPRKMLLRETGKALIQHTYEAACQARLPAGVCIATDHEEIFAEVQRFGGDVEMTDPALPSGTDRVAEIARRRPGFDLFVNVQGDEPELRGEAIDHLIDLFRSQPGAVMTTLATPIRSKEKLFDPACVKVVFDSIGRALYFSRSPIPCARNWEDSLLDTEPPHFFQHLGIYAYSREFLLGLSKLPVSRLENLEKLEQLRVLEAGHTILVGIVDEPSIGIDTPADYAAFVRRVSSPGSIAP